MANRQSVKRGFKLQEFAAHSTKVNCAYFGRKFSGVLVTGGEDRKINMWAVGKPHALLSLSGHQSAVESVMFDKSEESVLAGAAGGTVKMWDLEQARVVRTFTGHRANCLCLDYHPFGQFFGSGSLDTNFKVWDVRQKVCIHTYKGHQRGVTQVKFSPDGKWIVSGDQEGLLRIWDLTAGKLIHEFKGHTNAITKVRFHPNEYFLASSSADRTVKFWDLDTFSMVETAGPEATTVRAIEFTPSGEAMFYATQDCLKVWTWEPVMLHDYVDVQWSKLTDICLRDDKLMGVTLNQSFVGVWVVDLARVAPFSRGEISLETKSEASVYMKENTAPEEPPTQLQPQTTRKQQSFPLSSANPVVVTQDLIENLKNTRIAGDVGLASQVGGEEEDNGGAAPSLLHHPEPETTEVGTGMGDSFFNMELLHRKMDAASALGDGPGEVRQSSSSAQVLRLEEEGNDPQVQQSSSSPNTSSGPVGLDFDSFAASTSDALPREEDVEQYRSDKQIAHDLLQKHEVMSNILSARLTKMRAVREVWQKGDMRKTVNYILAMKDKSVLVDTIQPILKKKTMLKLDMICSLIPPVCGLVSDAHENWTLVSLDAITEMNAMFADLILSVCSAAPTRGAGIDLHFEEKLEYCQRARSNLLGLRPTLAALKAHKNQKVSLKALELDNQLSVYLS